jgi:manganese efflux pump family protein
MDVLGIPLIAVSLAMDCFAVSLGVGCSPVPIRSRLIFRIAFHFGLFQGGMTLLGWLIGSTIVDYIAAVDHWIAFGLLAWVGIRMIVSGLKVDEDEDCDPEGIADPSRGRSLVMLSIATSIDALAVGLGLSFVKANVPLASLVIGITSTVLALAGLLIGDRLSRVFGRRMEILGGVILNFIGLRILISHLAGV